MKISRRLFLGGLIVGATAPAIIKNAMPIKVVGTWPQGDYEQSFGRTLRPDLYRMDGTSTGRWTSKANHFEQVPKSGRLERNTEKAILFGYLYGQQRAQELMKADREFTLVMMDFDSTRDTILQRVREQNAAHDIFRL